MNSNSDGSETMDRVSGRLPGADAFPVALLQIDAGGRVRGCNAAWIDALEAPARDAPMAGYLHPEDRAIWSGMLQRLTQGGAATARERLRLVHPDGRLLWCDVSVRGADDGGGERGADRLGGDPVAGDPYGPRLAGRRLPRRRPRPAHRPRARPPPSATG